MKSDFVGGIFRPLLLLVIVTLGVSPALAHRQPEVVGTVVYAVEDGAPVTKVTWRLHAHDALDALALLPEAAAPDFDSETTLIEIAGYVASWVDYSDGEVTTLGAEVEANYVFVYQLIGGHVTVEKAGVLSDLDPGWSNLVNIEDPDGEHSSVIFTRDYPYGTEAATR